MPRKLLLTPEQIEEIVDGANPYALGTKFGVDRTIIVYYARKRGVQLERQKRVSNHDWASVDWARPVMELAMEFGVTDSWVRKMRGRYAPKGKV